MAENTYAQRYSADDSSTAGAFAFDTINSKDYGVSKLAFGAIGSVTYVSASDPLPVTISGVATAANQTTGNASLASIDGKITACNTGAVVVSSMPTTTVTGTVAATQSGTWSVTNISGTVSLPTGAATAAKQPALGTAGTASADVITVQGIASMVALKVDGSGVTQPISGSVTANIGTVGTLATAANQTTGNSSLATIAGAVSGTEMQVDIVSMPAVTISGTVTVGSHAVTNAGTFAVQVDGAALTSLQLLDDSVATTGSAITSKGMAAVGTDGTNARILKTDTAGELQIDVLSSALPTGAATETTLNSALTALQLIDDGIATAGSAITSKAMAIAGTDGSLARILKVNTDGSLQIAPTASATFDVHLYDGLGNMLTTNTRGSVQALSVEIVDASGNQITSWQGNIAHDSADSGNPIKIGGRARSSNIAAVAENDRSDLIQSLVGKLLTLPYALPASTWSYAAASGGITNTTGVQAKAAAGVGIRNYVCRVAVINGHATVSTEVIIRDGTAGTVLWRGWAQAAGGGCAAVFDPPLRGSDNTLIQVENVTTGAATYFNLQGYEAAE